MQMVLNGRQRLAQALTREINGLGCAWVTNAMPLRDDEELRLQILDENRSQVLEKLSNWGWAPTPCGNLPRITAKGFCGATLYQLDLPRQRQAIADDRAIPAGIVADENNRREKTPLEVEAMRKYLGWKT
jgi:hypothetical protein